MPLFNLIVIAISLSLDAAAVSAANGAHHPRMSGKKAFKIAFFFGLFQGLMPLAGWFIGWQLSGLIFAIDHWIAFFLLFLIGAKMLFESAKSEDDKSTDIKNNKILLLLSVATSIDAAVVGVSFGFIDINIFWAAFVIGIITFVISLASVYIGKRFGERWGKKAEAAGGLCLIFIGIKMLLQHLL